MHSLTLEEYRRSARLSRIELARLAKMADSTIWRIEHARHVPVYATRRKLAEALQVNRLELIAWPEEVSRIC